MPSPVGAAPPLSALRVEVPTPYPVGPVNAWVVGTGDVTLIDPGPNTPEGRDALFDGLSSLGVAVERVERVVITHAHPDHYGLAPEVRARSRCAVLAGRRDLPKLGGGSMLGDAGRLLLAEGVPGSLLREIDALERRLGDLHPAVERVLPLDGGELLRFSAGGPPLRVHSAPGHTGGHVCLFEEVGGTLFSGDTLLPDVSPNPLIEPDALEPGSRRPSLVEYLATLDDLAALGPRRVLPGHGDPVVDPAELIAQTLAHHRGRLEVVSGLLDDAGKTGWALAGELFPGRDGFDHVLAVSEVVAHVDVLIRQGRAARDVREGIARYRSV